MGRGLEQEKDKQDVCSQAIIFMPKITSVAFYLNLTLNLTPTNNAQGNSKLYGHFKVKFRLLMVSYRAHFSEFSQRLSLNNSVGEGTMPEHKG